MILAEPYWLLLLLLLPLLIWYYRRIAKQRHIALQVSRLSAMKTGKTWVQYARNWLQVLRWITFVILIVAMARPQQLWYEAKTEADALDIMLVMDVSPSMLSKDIAPDRLSAAKQIASDFISRRPYDRIGLVIFSGGAFTQCPLTNDHRILKVFVNNLQVGRIKDGSALGLGIATAVNHLKDSQAASKVVILLTDGENNREDLGPVKSAAIASAFGVKVYTIGLGTDGVVSSPARLKPSGEFEFTDRKMELDTTLLTMVSGLTGGEFYRARSAQDLNNIYTTIDQLEKTKITSSDLRRTRDLHFPLLNMAFCLLLLEMVLRWGALRVITV
ncbi:MAG: VWA domain-containing protein [Lewinellaceae bacterium]|nr:VWA domain-containing protein [Lewinellaceae bacterium]